MDRKNKSKLLDDYCNITIEGTNLGLNRVITARAKSTEAVVEFPSSTYEDWSSGPRCFETPSKVSIVIELEIDENTSYAHIKDRHVSE